MNQAMIQIQEKACCAHPHEGCNPDESYVAYQQEYLTKKEIWVKRIEELKEKEKALST